MKKILIILIIGIYSNIILVAQSPCPVSQSCKNETFPYKICSGNKLKTICTNDPYDIEKNGGIPLKLDFSLCYNSESFINPTHKVHHDAETTYVWTYHDETDDNGYYGRYGIDGCKPIYSRDDLVYKITINPTTANFYTDGEYIPTPFFTHDIDQITEEYDTEEPCDQSIFMVGNDLAFNPGSVESNINAALNLWKSICANGNITNSSYLQNCSCISVKWSQTANDFKASGVSETSEVCALTNTPLISGTCNYDCNSLYILLNQSDDYTSKTDDGCIYYSFFTTGYVLKRYNSVYWISLTNVFAHEIGHLLGFAHQDDGAGLGCSHLNNTVMQKLSTGPDQNPINELSDDDRCMYAKLYCCDAPTVITDLKPIDDVSINMFPNPTNTNKITISINKEKYNCILFYKVYSFDGTEVLNGNFKSFTNKQKIIDLIGISSGSYIIILNCENKTFMQKFEKLK